MLKVLKKVAICSGPGLACANQTKVLGTIKEEDLRREELRTVLREWQEQQAADPTPHELALNEETDLVCCGRCKRSAAARTWRANFSAACPGPGGQTEEERRREMKRGKAATARLTGNTGLFGVGEGARPPRQVTRSGGTHKKPISKSASRKAAAAASGGSRPPAPSSEIEVAAAVGPTPENWTPACSGSRGPKEAAGEVRALGARLIFLEAPSSATFGVLPRGVGAGFKRTKNSDGEGTSGSDGGSDETSVD